MINYSKYSEHNLSKFQKDIIEYVANSRGHLVVEAGPGSGKTALLVILSKVIGDCYPTDDSIFVAFNKSIATELGEKLDGVSSRTINSLFFKYYMEHMGFQKAYTNKYWDIVKLAMRAGGIISNNEDQRAAIEKQMKKAVDIFRATLCNLDDEDEMFDTSRLYQFDLIPPSKYRVYKAILAYGELIGKCKNAKEVEKGIYDYDPSFTPIMFTMHRKYIEEKSPRFPVIDFVDQIWISHLNGWVTRDFDNVLVDELQDLNKLQREALFSTLKEGGRFIGVGDPDQACYLFSGSASSSIEDIANALNAKTLPLSVIYRCPLSHVRLAQEIVPDIIPFDNAIEGTIDYDISYSSLVGAIDEVGTKFDGSTLVVSRRNAPLVSLAYKLVAAKIPFILKGRDFGKSIEKVVKAVCYDSTGKKVKDGFDMESFLYELESWLRKQIHNLDKANAERPSYINLMDKYDSVRILFLSSVANSPEELLSEIEKMFPDETLNGANTVTLCSIHKAKGLERDSVFVLEHNKLPFFWEKQTEEQGVQEMNLLFVALTRSKNYLGLVLSPPKEEDIEE